MSGAPSRRRAPKVWLPLLVTVLAAIGIELALRGYEIASGRELAGASPVVEDAEAGFSLSPRYRGYWWHTDVRLDEWGFRNGPRAEPGSHAVRILNLGDSTTFGVSVGADETYSRILQSALDRRQPGRFDVLNAGVPGYSSREARKQIERKGIFERTRPDLVTIYLGWNDHWLARSESPADAPPRDRGWLRQLKARLLERSVLLRLADDLRVRAFRSVGERMGRATRRTELDVLLDARARGARPASAEAVLNVPASDFADNLDAIVGAAQSRGARVVLIVPPAALEELLPSLIAAQPVAPLPFFFHDEYQDVIRRVGAQRGVPVVDLPRRLADEDRSALFSDPIHPNAAGHRIIAEEILHALD